MAASTQAGERHQGEPELRRGHPSQGHDTDDLVGEPVALGGGDHAKRYAEHDGERHRSDRELSGRGDVLGEVGAHRPPALLRFAQVAVKKVAQIHHVLDRHRLVEPEMLSVELHRDRVGRCPVSEVRERGITRHEVGEDESHHGHPQA